MEIKKRDFFKRKGFRLLAGGLLFFAGILLFAGQAWGAGDTYESDVGGGTGYWNVAGSWIGGSSYPGDGSEDDIVNIVDGDNINFELTSIIVRELNIDDTPSLLGIYAGDLTVKETLANSGQLIVSMGILTVEGVVTNSGELLLDGGGVTALDAATLINTSTGKLTLDSGGGGILTVDELENNGGQINIESGALTIAKLENKGYGTVVFDGSASGIFGDIRIGTLTNENGATVTIQDLASGAHAYVTTFENEGTLEIIDNAGFTLNGSYSGDGTVSLNNSNVTVAGNLNMTGGTLNVDNSSLSTLNLKGGNNSINEINATSSSTDFKIAGTGGNEVTVNSIQFNNSANKISFESIIANLSSTVYTDDGTVTLADATGYMGAGNVLVNFIFEDGSTHWIGNKTTIKDFNASTITYNDGSKVYIKIGSGANDTIITDYGINFNGNVEVVLYNLGNHTANVVTGEVFIGTVIELGSVALDDTSVTYDDVAQTLSTGSDTIKFSTVGLKLNDVDYGNYYLGFDVTGTITMNLPPNVQTLLDVIDTMPGSDLETALLGSGDFYAALAELDPLPLSLGAKTTHLDVTKFNQSLFNRLQHYQNYGWGNPYASADRKSGTVIRAQNGSCSCSSTGCGGHAYGCGGFPGGSSELWFEALGSFSDQDKRNGIVGYRSDTVGFGVGIDRRLNRQLVAGLGFGGTFTEARAKEGLGKTTVDNYIGSLYGSYTENCWTFSAAGGYAYSSLKSSRVAGRIGGYANGSRGANTWFSSLELARRFGCQARYLTPFYGFDFIGYREDGYNETGHLINMMVNARKADGYLQTVGVRLGTRFQQCNGWIINPELTAGWIHDYGDGDMTTAGRFAEGGTPFTVIGTSRNKDRALLGVGVNTLVMTGLSAFARYDGELADGYNNQTVQAGLNMAF